MILHLDHIGLAARSLEEASDLFIETLGFAWDIDRTPMPTGLYMAQENAWIYFIKVGDGKTQIELLLPQDRKTGMGRWLDRRGPSVHHLAYMVDDLETDAAELVDKGLQRIDLGPDAGAAFFYPRSTMGVLTELVDVNTNKMLHRDAASANGPDPALALASLQDFQAAQRLERERLAAEGADHDHDDGADHGHTHSPGQSHSHSHAHPHPHQPPRFIN